MMQNTDTQTRAAGPRDDGHMAALAISLGALRPINRLPKEVVDNIAERTTLYQASVGESLSQRVADEIFVHYLLEGSVQIFDANGETETLIASDPNAKNALGRLTKSAQDIVANCPSKLARIPWESLEKHLIQYAPAELSSTLEVQEILSSTSSDWMVRLLQSDLFSLLPASNIQKVMASLEFVDTLPDEIIITEGERGEHFFIVDHGDFLVSKQNTKTGDEVELAHLTSDDFFGEEALITGAPRGATVTSLGNGRLIKINNETFKNCIVAPAVPLLSADQAGSLVGKGAAYLDIRTPEKSSDGVIPDSAHIIPSLLRSNRNTLDKQQTYVVIDDTPTAAAHAAFLLRAKGYDARCLNLPLEKYAVLQGIRLCGETGHASSINTVNTPLEQHTPAIDAEPVESDPCAETNTLEPLDCLSAVQNDLPTQTADTNNYAQTLTGVDLANLIDELNEAYETKNIDENAAVKGGLSDEESKAESEANVSDIASLTLLGGESERKERAWSRRPDAQTREALKSLHASLTAEFEKKLRQQQAAATEAVEAHKAKLDREYQQKRAELVENGKKLIALANKVSQQKAEIQSIRREMAPDLGFIASGDTDYACDHTSSATNADWSSSSQIAER